MRGEATKRKRTKEPKKGKRNKLKLRNKKRNDSVPKCPKWAKDRQRKNKEDRNKGNKRK